MEKTCGKRQYLYFCTSTCVSICTFILPIYLKARQDGNLFGHILEVIIFEREQSEVGQIEDLGREVD